MKKIGFWTTLALVIGNIIGAGIFTTGGYLAEKISNPYFFMLAWVVGGIYALSGAVVYGLLSKEMPENGGDYVYLKNTYHPYFGYLFGWSGLFVTYAGSIAALAIGAAHYFNDLFPLLNLEMPWWQIDIAFTTLSFTGIRFVAFLLIVIFTYINHIGIRSGGGTQFVLTASILLLMVGFIGAGLFSGAQELIIPRLNPVPGTGLFFSALPAVLFTYMGWTTAVYIAGEVDQPGKTVPLALMIGVLIVTVIYFGMNYIFLSTTPAAELAGKVDVVNLVSTKLWGDKISGFITIMIIVAILSSINSTILSGPRIYQRMAADNLLWNKLRRLHQKYQTPYYALWIQAAWSIVLLFSGTFNELLTMVVAAILIFSILSAIVALKIMLKHSFSIWKWIAAITYICLCFLVLLSILAEHGKESLWGALLLLVSLPFYLLQRRRSRNA